MALLGLFSSLEHDGRQILGSNSQGPLDPKHGKDGKVGRCALDDEYCGGVGSIRWW
jgi:hypothetical protein